MELGEIPHCFAQLVRCVCCAKFSNALSFPLGKPDMQEGWENGHKQWMAVNCIGQIICASNENSGYSATSDHLVLCHGLCQVATVYNLLGSVETPSVETMCPRHITGSWQNWDFSGESFSPSSWNHFNAFCKHCLCFPSVLPNLIKSSWYTNTFIKFILRTFHSIGWWSITGVLVIP